MPDSAILKAFLDRLNAYSTALPVAYLGKNWNQSAFVPPSSGMWLESSYFPNEPGDFMWRGSSARQMGFFQIDVRFRSDTPEHAARTEAGLIAAHFEKGRQLTGEIRIDKRPYTSPRVTDEASAYIPVTIPYQGVG